jgi:regulator of sigma E protease
MLTIIVIVFLFALLVILHEWGHFLAARRGGVDVDEFGIGFPPKIWGKKVGPTLYTINLLPLGGFVRLKGEDTADNGPHTFGGARFGTKAKILLAGVGMNLVTAVVILYALALVGLPALGAQFEPNFLKHEYAQPKQLILAQVEDGSPAAKAGIKRGDFVLRANGKDLKTDEDLRNFTKANAGHEVLLHVRSSGDERDVKVKLRERLRRRPDRWASCSFSKAFRSWVTRISSCLWPISPSRWQRSTCCRYRLWMAAGSRSSRLSAGPSGS